MLGFLFAAILIPTLAFSADRERVEFSSNAVLSGGDRIVVVIGPFQAAGTILKTLQIPADKTLSGMIVVVKNHLQTNDPGYSMEQEISLDYLGTPAVDRVIYIKNPSQLQGGTVVFDQIVPQGQTWDMTLEFYGCTHGVSGRGSLTL